MRGVAWRVTCESRCTQSVVKLACRVHRLGSQRLVYAAMAAEQMGIEEPALPLAKELFYTEGPPELKAARL